MKFRLNSFNFTRSQIKEHLTDGASWHKFVREFEFESLIKVINGPFENALELGAGNGDQSEVIAKHCKQLTCTELEEEGSKLIIGKFKSRNLPNVTYKLCDATDLSAFPDDSFDFVYSSNMVEHILNWNKCLIESKRVLKSNGLMVHIMPSRDWKFWNSVNHLLSRRRPPLHGVELTNMKEFKAFGEKSWIKRIHSSDLKVTGLLRMPFYFGAGTKYRWILILGNILKWKSSTAYIIVKK